MARGEGHMVSNMRIAALMPIKGHSERIPEKNFRDFCGRPFYHWVLDALQGVGAIKTVVINTDAREKLLETGVKEFPAVQLRTRKPELCGDLVSMNLVLADDVENVEADVYVMTHSTNPLLTTETIGKALDAFDAKFRTGECDSLFSVNKVQTRFYRGDGSAVNHDPENLVRTQDLEPWFEENSNLYVFSREAFQQAGRRIGRKPMMFVTPRLDSIDIDDWDDWILAEHLCRARHGSGQPS